MPDRFYPGEPVTLTVPTLLILGESSRGAVGTWFIELETDAATYSMVPRGRNRAAGVDPDGTAPELLYMSQTDATLTWEDGAVTPIEGTAETAVRLFKIAGDGLRLA